MLVLIVTRATVVAAVQAVPAAPGWSAMTVVMTVVMGIWPRRSCDGGAWPTLSLSYPTTTILRCRLGGGAPNLRVGAEAPPAGAGAPPCGEGCGGQCPFLDAQGGGASRHGATQCQRMPVSAVGIRLVACDTSNVAGMLISECHSGMSLSCLAASGQEG